MTAQAYMAYGLVVSALGLLAAASLPQHRKVILLSGLCAAPLGLGDALFVPEYWEPGHHIGKNLSIEGVAFSFGNGALLWMVAALPWRNRVRYRTRYMNVLRRYLGCSLVATLLFFSLWRGGFDLAGLPVMTAGIASILAVAAFVFAVRPQAVWFALTGMVGFLALYGVELVVLSLLLEDPGASWAPAIRAGASFFGFPIEELAWAGANGAAWAAAVCFGSDVSLDTATAR